MMPAAISMPVHLPLPAGAEGKGPAVVNQGMLVGVPLFHAVISKHLGAALALCMPVIYAWLHACDHAWPCGHVHSPVWCTHMHPDCMRGPLWGP